MENIKISVIIPIYNMAEWIEHAIETVEKQTLKEIEIICVDDGSTDNSREILYNCKKNENNIIVLCQENKGAGPARNYALDYARGEYVAFLDADDYYYSNDALEYLYQKAKKNNADICRGSSCDDREGVLCFKGLRPERVFHSEGYIQASDFAGVGGFWAGIYKREFLTEKHCQFPPLRRFQDSVFWVDALSKAGTVYCTDKVVYVYRKEHKTVCYTEKKATDSVYGIYSLMEIASSRGLQKIFKSYKKEIFGEPEAMLYKYAAEGNKTMLELASKLNGLIGGGLYEGDEIKAYVDRVAAEKQPYLEHLKSLDAVYVFGAGTVGKKVIGYLLENGISITAVIVSDPTYNPETVDGIPVKPVSAIDCKQNYEVIIATFWYLHDQIIQTLKEQGVDKVYPLDLCAFHLWQEEIIH